MKIIICFHYIFYIWILFTEKALTKLTEKSVLINKKRDITNINILIDKPENIIIDNEWNINNYNNVVNQYLKEKLNNVEVNFSYNENASGEIKNKKEYEDYVNYILNQLKKFDYDIFILDEKFLFGDISTIESSYVRNTFNERNIQKYYLNLSEYFEKNKHMNKRFDNDAFHEAYTYIYSFLKDNTSDTNIYNHDIVSGGFMNDILYGLPYEIDFNIVYNTDKQKANLENDHIFKSINLVNDDKLFATFIEYLYSVDNNIEEFLRYHIKDENSNNKERNYIDSFRNYLLHNNKFSTSDLDALTLNNTFNNLKNDHHSFYGKASHYCSIKSQKDIGSVSKSFLFKKTVVNKKYLVINKNSQINKDLLFQVALQLTSSDFQTVTFEKLCKLPTYTMNEVKPDVFHDDLDYKNIVESVESIDMKKLFTSEYSAPFMEIRAFLPEALKKFLIDGNSEPIVDMLENIYYLVMDKNSNKDVSTLGLYIPMVIFTIVSIIIIGLVIKYKEHPRVKLLSPGLCIIIIIGYSIDIPLTPYFMIQNPSILKCKYEFIESILDSSLIMFPMVAITYRIYSIYNNTSKVVIGKRLKNKRLFIILGTLFIISVVTAAITAFFIFHFYLESYGNISTYRQQTCEFDESDGFTYVDYGIFFILLISIVYMIIKTGKISKHYGEFNFIYGLILILIAESLRDFIIPYLPANGYFTYYVIFLIAYMVYNILCVYIIVGSRLIYAIRHPEQEFSNKADSNFTKSTTNLISKDKKKSNSSETINYNIEDENEIENENENETDISVHISFSSPNSSNKTLYSNE
ncbi:hypothetical protein BCR36DRAFT_337135, partial [Piromyces finnis]